MSTGMIVPIPIELPDADELGKVTISYKPAGPHVGINVECEGFEWPGCSCRESAILSMIWARKALDAAIQADHRREP